MMALISRFVAVTRDPLGFIDFLKSQDWALYDRIGDLVVFEEVVNEHFRLQKLYQPGIWDKDTGICLDMMWCRYCGFFPTA